MNRSVRADAGDRYFRQKGPAVSAKDKVTGKAEVAKGKVKKATGKAVGNPRLQGEGKAKEVKGNLKQARGKAKDVGKKVKDAGKK